MEMMETAEVRFKELSMAWLNKSRGRDVTSSANTSAGSCQCLPQAVGAQHVAWDASKRSFALKADLPRWTPADQELLNLSWPKQPVLILRWTSRLLGDAAVGAERCSSVLQSRQ